MSAGPGRPARAARSARAGRAARCPARPGVPGPVVAYRHSVPPMSERRRGVRDRLAVRRRHERDVHGLAVVLGGAEASAIARRSSRGSRTHTARPRAPARPRPRAGRSSPRRRRAARRRPAGRRGRRRAARSRAARRTCRRPGRASPSASSSLTSGGREPDLLGEPAGIERRRAKLLAQRLVPAPAAPARAARHVVVDDDAVADGDARHRRRPRTSTSPTTSWPSTHGSLRAT